MVYPLMMYWTSNISVYLQGFSATANYQLVQYFFFPSKNGAAFITFSYVQSALLDGFACGDLPPNNTGLSAACFRMVQTRHMLKQDEVCIYIGHPPNSRQAISRHGSIIILDSINHISHITHTYRNTRTCAYIINYICMLYIHILENTYVALSKLIV